MTIFNFRSIWLKVMEGQQLVPIILNGRYLVRKISWDQGQLSCYILRLCCRKLKLMIICIWSIFWLYLWLEDVITKLSSKTGIIVLSKILGTKGLGYTNWIKHRCHQYKTFTLLFHTISTLRNICYNEILSGMCCSFCAVIIVLLTWGEVISDFEFKPQGTWLVQRI